MAPEGPRKAYLQLITRFGYKKSKLIFRRRGWVAVNVFTKWRYLALFTVIQR